MKVEYEELLSKNYDEAVVFLLKKYGPATADYYSEKSYNRFKAGEIKSIAKGKISRTSEGLYCHHIDEDKVIMISTQDVIKMLDIPYDYQRKERLVYCDLIEHGILHVLIAIENKNKSTLGTVGIGGYINFIRPELYLWFIMNEVPTATWRKNCYEKVYMEKNEAIELLAKIDNFLVNNYQITHEMINEATENYFYKIR
ncbi:hypothetical protein Hs30E_07500 [Lactococcus hodotermopsidis]|uniref:Uncharacterized protein n=1 Tax=Pseudolactococcus hodotermopsidis TaxID=2709157 RepID=A0A6A0B9S3_9LACT|nr:hypothetical protein Hs30E_07500 [Lactococcus hodotermopsidis]